MKKNQASEAKPVGMGLPRRDFLKFSAGFAAGMASSHSVLAKQGDLSALPLGMVTHSLRRMRWKPAQHIAYAAGLKLDAVSFNSIRDFESLDTAYLTDLKNKAASHGMQIYIGAGSISKNSVQFRDDLGPPEELVRVGIEVATAVGSPVVGVRIGNIDDRFSEGGIEARIEESIQVLKATRNIALDSGIQFAFENHAGDMRSEELLGLIEAVGTDVCGVLLDPGNAVWAMEDPMKQVQVLGKYTLCSSIRDTMVWPSENGATYQWTALGDGLMDVSAYVRTLAEVCPDSPILVETISNSQRPIPFLTEEHMKAYPNLKAEGMIDFLKLLRRGHPILVDEASAGEDPKSFEQNHQRHEFEQSIAYLRNVCGVGKKVML